MLTIAKRYRFLATLLLVAMTYSTSAASNAERRIVEVIAEASDYNLVKPKHSLATLEANQNLVKQASGFHRYMFFKTGFSAAVYMYDSAKVFYYLEKMLESYQFPNNEPYFSELMYSFSIWYGINQQYVLATTAGICAMDSANSNKELSRSSIALGLTYLMTDNYPEAKQVLELNLKISKKEQNLKLVSAANNNLALLHIFTGQYALAEQHLRTALSLNEKMARANGTALNLTNLLLVYYLQNDWQTFSRLINRTIRKTDSLDNQDLKHYIAWLNSAFKIKTNQGKGFEVNGLLEHYEKVVDPMIIKLISVIASDLQIRLPKYQAAYYGDIVNFAERFAVCSNYRKKTKKATAINSGSS